MGRPRRHAEQTRAALRTAAERLVAEGGPAALSVRAVADAAGTTTRAVYTLFGSKDGLLLDAVAQGAFEFLADGIEALPETDDPVYDMHRRLARVCERLDAGETFVFAHQKTTDAAGHTKDPKVKQALQQCNINIPGVS